MYARVHDRGWRFVDGNVAQLAEYWIPVPGVGGSIPSFLTFCCGDRERDGSRNDADKKT